MPFSTSERPEQAAAWCLSHAGWRPRTFDAVACPYDPSLAPVGGEDDTAAGPFYGAVPTEAVTAAVAGASAFVAAGLPPPSPTTRPANRAPPEERAPAGPRRAGRAGRLPQRVAG